MSTFFRQIALLLVILIWLLSGCSHTYPITFTAEKPRGDTLSAGTVNRRLATKEVVLITRDGRELPASKVFLTRDSCLFTDSASAGAFLPTADIVMVRHVDHLSSAVGGFGLGALGGFAVGMGGALLLKKPGDADSGMGAGIFAIGMTVAGSLVGMIVGGTHGTINDYTMPGASPDSTLPHPEGGLRESPDPGTRSGSGANGS